MAAKEGGGEAGWGGKKRREAALICWPGSTKNMPVLVRVVVEELVSAVYVSLEACISRRRVL